MIRFTVELESDKVEGSYLKGCDISREMLEDNLAREIFIKKFMEEALAEFFEQEELRCK